MKKNIKHESFFKSDDKHLNSTNSILIKILQQWPNIRIYICSMCFYFYCYYYCYYIREDLRLRNLETLDGCIATWPLSTSDIGTGSVPVRWKFCCTQLTLRQSSQCSRDLSHALLRSQVWYQLLEIRCSIPWQQCRSNVYSRRIKEEVRKWISLFGFYTFVGIWIKRAEESLKERDFRIYK